MGSVVTLPLKFSCHMDITNMEQYIAYYAGKRVCVELQDVVTKCNPVLHPDIIFHDLPEGDHTARAFVTDDGGVERQHLTRPTRFSIVSEEGYEVHAANLVEQRRASLDLPRDVNLLEWVKEQHEELPDIGSSVNTPISLHADGTELVLVIGIKTAVVTNFARRQAIRDTWAQDARKYGAKVLFLGCNPNMSGVHDERDQQYLQDAVNAEKKIYGDLLTEELECEDSYGVLAEKVVAFFHLAAAEFTQTPYVMIVDDDIYLRVDKLIQLLQQKGREKGTDVYGSSVELEFYSYFSSYSSRIAPELFAKASVSDEQTSALCIWSSLRDFDGLCSLSFKKLLATAEFEWTGGCQCRAVVTSEASSPGIHTTVFASYYPALQTQFNLICRVGVRIIHTNLLGGKAFCHGFDRLAWNRYISPSRLEMVSAIPTPKPRIVPTVA